MIPDIAVLLILAIVQGVTEWLPISSSGHLIILERLFAHPGGLTFDIALHFGTLMAVFVYFGREITDVIRAFCTGKWRSADGRLGVMLVIATIPAAVAGYFLAPYFTSVLSDFRVLAFGFGITGLFLFVGSLEYTKKRKFGIASAFVVGCVQAVAIIPGISRSGSTLAASLLLGLKEKEAMKFSFMLSIPIIFGASIVTIGNNPLPTELIWATLLSFIVGLITIHLLFTRVLISRKNYRWFGGYCIILGIVLGILVL